MSENGKPVLLLVPADGFREEQLTTTRNALDRNGMKIVMASTVTQGANGSDGRTVDPDLLIDAVKPEDYRAVVLIGGFGASQYWYDARAHDIIRTLFRQGKIVAAIGRAPASMGAAGILRGKKVTGHVSIREKLINYGAEYTGRTVERDSNLLTGEGASASTAFANELLELLREQPVR